MTAPLLLAASLFAGPADADAAATTIYAGRVVTPDGWPAAGAVVFLPDFGEVQFSPGATATAGPDGRFALPPAPVEKVARSLMNLKHGRGLVAVPAGWGRGAADQDPGDAPLAPGLLPVPPPLPGRTCDVGDVPLSPGSVISGRVTDDAGAPVAGAAVEVTCSARYAASTRLNVLPGATVQTGPDGRFATPPLPPCEVELTIAAAGFRRGVRSLSPDGIAAAVVLRPIALEAEIPTVLDVVRKDGNPAAGMTVWAYPSYEPLLTGPDGRVRLRGLGPTDPLLMRLEGPGVRKIPNSRPDPTEPLPDGTRRFAVTVERERLLKFAVVDAATGAPVTVSSVVLCSYERDADGTPRLTGCTNPAVRRPVPGRVAIAHLGPNAYHLAIAADGYETSDMFLDPLPDDGNHDVGPFKLARRTDGGSAGAGPAGALTESIVSGTVAGVVEPTGGADPAWALVTLWTKPGTPSRAGTADLTFGRRAPSPGFCVASTVADAAGRFSLTVPRTGDHLLHADCAPAGLAPGDPVTPADRPAPAVLPVAVRAGENAATLAGAIAGRADVRPRPGVGGRVRRGPPAAGGAGRRGRRVPARRPAAR